MQFVSTWLPQADLLLFLAFTYAASLKSVRMQAVISAIDSGSGPGTIEICSAGYAAVLASIVLADPSFTESGGVITMADAPRRDEDANASGQAAVARIKNAEGTVIVNDLTVTATGGGGDIELASITVVQHTEVELTSGTLTHG
jgi:hypothetical protein